MTLKPHPKPPKGKVIGAIPSGYDPTGKDDVAFDPKEHKKLLDEAKKGGKTA